MATRTRRPRGRTIDGTPASYMLTRLSRAIGRRLKDSELTLSGPQCIALLALRRESPLSNAQLARRALVTPQAMNEVVLELEREGLIEREAAADNRRVLRARLTDTGRNVLTDWDTAISGVEEALFDGFSAAEVATFVAALERCVVNLGLSGAPQRL